MLFEIGKTNNKQSKILHNIIFLKLEGVEGDEEQNLDTEYAWYVD
jgi:hypothetical protein